MFLSYPLFVSLLGVVLAQVIKIPLYWLVSRKWEWKIMFSTGGMPSSHTAMVTALATAIGLTEGAGSGLFAMAAVFAIIVMHDAAGVRRHAGYHAAVLNQMLRDLNTMKEHLKKPIPKDSESRENLKELLGHKPIEVFFGALMGIGLALLIYPYFPM